MDDQQQVPTDAALLKWFSSYGLITVDRIFARFGLQLSQEELKRAVNDTHSLYHQFLRVPFKNILNGIILAQAEDYREFAQKLFIDYLVSGAGNQPDPKTPLEGTKEQLEQERLQLIELGNQFDLDEFEQNKQIAHSQKALIALAKKYLVHPQTPNEEILTKINEDMTPYHAKADELNQSLREFRQQFYNLIIRVKDLMMTIPEYHLDQQKLVENRESLDFNADIGEK